MGPQPVISVVVCTYNRAQLLENCIQSLFKQDLDRDFFEIIVVNNESTDETPDILAKFEGEVGFRSIYEPVSGLSKARNSGWISAKGEYVGYLDDDAVADQQWLKSALWCFENILPKPDALTGPIQLFGDVSLPDWINDDLKVPLGFLDWGTECFQIQFEHNKIVGANCFFSKAILQQMGGFSEKLGRKKKLLLSGEEVQLQQNIERSGGTVWYHPNVSVKHYVPEQRTIPAWFYKRYYWGGVSDFIMSRSSFSIRNDEVDDFLNKQKDGMKIVLKEKREQISRLLTNLFHSLGIFSEKSQTIQSRIYLSYVCGYMISIVTQRSKA